MYHTFYAIGWCSFPWGGILFFAIPIGIGLTLIRYSGGKQIRQAVGGFFIIFSVFLLFLVSMISVSSFMKFRHAYVTGNYSVVEGKIENFRPMPALGRADESFSIGDVSFSYNVLDDTSCFNNAHPRRIIRSGLSVRVFYTDGCILRLDVAGPVR